MALTFKHNFVSPIVDQADPTLLGPDEWNDDHAVAVTPINGVVFADALTSLNVDADFTWVSGLGLTIGGATETLGVVTPGVGGEHAAIGNYAVIDTFLYAPGDAPNTFTFGAPITLNVTDAIATDFRALPGEVAIGLELSNSFKNTGVDAVHFQAATGIDQEMVIPSDSTGVFNNVTACSVFAENFGSGGMTQFTGINMLAEHNGSGTITNINGILMRAFIDPGAGAVTNLTGGFFSATAGSTITDHITCGEFSIFIFGGTTVPTAYSVLVDTPILYGVGAGITSNYGIYVQDQSGIGGTVSENIHSAGASSLTKFEGHHYQGNYYETTEVTAPSAPPANGVRIYAQDNGAGKTQLMALFNTGAAQQVAIQP